MHIEQASKWNIGYINEVLGEYRKSSGTATDVSAPFYKKLIIGHHDAFDRALELGVDPWVVAKGRLLYNYSVAYRALLSNDLGGFKKFIQLEQADSQYASWKHRLFYALRFYPRLVLMLIKVKDIIYRIVSGVKKFTK
jgi:hypothetical protein